MRPDDLTGLEPWRHAFRVGVAPALSDAGLKALLLALKTDDPRLIQRRTTEPDGCDVRPERNCEGACAICFAIWQADGLKTIQAVEDAFGKACDRIDHNLNDYTGCAKFTRAYDAWTREEMRELLTPEVRLALKQRRKEERRAN